MDKKIFIISSIIVALFVGYFIGKPSKVADTGSAIVIKGAKSTPIDIVSLRQNATSSPVVAIEYPQFPRLPSALNETIAKAVQDNLSDFRSSVAENESARAATSDSYAALPPNAYSFMVTWQEAEINDSYVSLIIRFDQYSGGTNENSTLMTVNYDVKNDKLLNITDIVSGNDALREISTISREQLSNTLGIASDGNVSTDMLDAGTEPTLDNFSSFTFTDNIITIYFPKYAVAPGAYGEQKVTILRSAVK